MTAPAKRRLSQETRRRLSDLMDVGHTFIEAMRVLRRAGAVAYVLEGQAEPISEEEMARLRQKMRRQNQLAAWNAGVPEGTAVAVRFYVAGPEFLSRTRSKAWMLDSGQVLVLIEGKTGGFDLDFVRVIADQNGAVHA